MEWYLMFLFSCLCSLTATLTDVYANVAHVYCRCTTASQVLGGCSYVNLKCSYSSLSTCFTSYNKYNNSYFNTTYGLILFVSFYSAERKYVQDYLRDMSELLKKLRAVKRKIIGKRSLKQEWIFFF